jgi:hypothetical protein
VDNVIALYWEGLSDCSHVVRNINLEGAYIKTAVSWAPGTLIRLTLRIIAGDETTSGMDTFVDLWSNVIRSTPDGLGVEFVFRDREQRAELRQFLRHVYGGVEPWSE